MVTAAQILGRELAQRKLSKRGLAKLLADGERDGPQFDKEFVNVKRWFKTGSMSALSAARVERVLDLPAGTLEVASRPRQSRVNDLEIRLESVEAVLDAHREDTELALRRLQAAIDEVATARRRGSRHVGGNG